MKTCAGCRFNVDGPVAQNLKREVNCVRFPPTVSQISLPTQTAKGIEVQVVSVTRYPSITNATPACGEFLEPLKMSEID
jgi:hypothetical protein